MVWKQRGINQKSGLFDRFDFFHYSRFISWKGTTSNRKIAMAYLRRFCAGGIDGLAFISSQSSVVWHAPSVQSSKEYLKRLSATFVVVLISLQNKSTKFCQFRFVLKL
jgi:hypothetical protein